MSLLDEAIFGMKPKDFGTPALDRTSAKLAKGDDSNATKMGFTTYMTQRDSAEEEELHVAAPEDAELAGLLQQVANMDNREIANHIYGLTRAGKVSLENFVELLSAALDVNFTS